MTIFGLAVSPALGAAVLYDDEAAFLSVMSPTIFESFESTPLTGSTSEIQADGFSIQGTSLQVRDSDLYECHATDGLRYVLWNSDLGSVTFTFETPISAFGVTASDFMDNAGALLTIELNTGEVFPGAFTGTNPGGFEQFVGITDFAQPFTSITFTQETSLPAPERMGFDEVYLPEPLSLSLFTLGGIPLLRRRHL
jgi:hypothetical protein